MPDKPLLVTGNDNLTYSIVACLLNSGYPVNLYTINPAEANEIIGNHLSDIENENFRLASSTRTWTSTEDISDLETCSLAIIITPEDLSAKKEIIRQVSTQQPADTIIAVNAESISLDEIQQGVNHPERIIGLNWTEPAHITRFLEIISNDKTEKKAWSH